jgi:hypothetical protein
VGISAARVANVPNSVVADFAKSWSQNAPTEQRRMSFFAVFQDWHTS